MVPVAPSVTIQGLLRREAERQAAVELEKRLWRRQQYHDMIEQEFEDELMSDIMYDRMWGSD